MFLNISVVDTVGEIYFTILINEIELFNLHFPNLLILTTSL